MEKRTMKMKKKIRRSFQIDCPIVEFELICKENEKSIEESVQEMNHTSLSCERSSSPILTNEEVLPVLVSIKHDKSTSMHSIIMTKTNTNDQSNQFIYFEKNRSVETPSNHLRQQQDRWTHSHTFFYPHPCHHHHRRRRSKEIMISNIFHDGSHRKVMNDVCHNTDWSYFA